MEPVYKTLVLTLVYLVIIAECQKNKSELCSNPKPASLDAKWFAESEPKDGWHFQLGNEIARIHFGEILKGELLKATDDFSDMCGRFKFIHADSDKVDGLLLGFKDRIATWKCSPVNGTAEGVVSCDFASLYGRYNETDKAYLTFTDNKNFAVEIDCFPDGEIGWTAYSVTAVLPETEKNSILDHIESLGLSRNDVVPFYNEDCPTNEQCKK